MSSSKQLVCIESERVKNEAFQVYLVQLLKKKPPTPNRQKTLAADHKTRFDRDVNRKAKYKARKFTLVVAVSLSLLIVLVMLFLILNDATLHSFWIDNRLDLCYGVLVIVGLLLTAAYQFSLLHYTRKIEKIEELVYHSWHANCKNGKEACLRIPIKDLSPSFVDFILGANTAELFMSINLSDKALEDWLDEVRRLRCLAAQIRDHPARLSRACVSVAAV